MLVCWGSVHHRGGGVAVETYDSVEDAIERMKRIAVRRAQRSYVPT